VCGALLVAYQDMVYTGIDKVIVYGQRLPSRITEHHVYALPLEQRQDRFGASHELISHNPAIIEDILLEKGCLF
jgi:hypothetical protein